MDKQAPLNSQWLVIRISGADFLQSWVTDSIWLEHAESLITNMVAYLKVLANFRAVLHVNNSLVHCVQPASS